MGTVNTSCRTLTNFGRNTVFYRIYGTGVITPNHIHLLLSVSESGSPRTSTPTRQTATVSHFVSTFKRFCNKEYGKNIWQRGFYDHVIRCQEEYTEIQKYISESPTRWHYDKPYAEK